MSNKNHYETLGVKPDASPAEIKRAYRKRAEKAHPDKRSGSHAEMAEVAHAKDVLLNPTRRLLYDTTGQDSQPPIEARAHGLIMSAFIDGVMKDAPNLLHHAKQVVDGQKKEIEKQKADGISVTARLNKRRNAVTTKSGPNLLHMVIDQQLSDVGQKLAMLEHELEMIAYAEKELKKYKSEERLVQVVGLDWGSQWGSAATGST